MTRRLAWLLILFLAIPEAGWGATYFVRTDGSDANCSGLVDAAANAGANAPNCAVATVTKGIALAAVNADIVTIHSGTYFEAAALTISKAITVQGFTGELPAIRWGRSDTEVAPNTAWTAASGDIGGGGSCPSVATLATGTYISASAIPGSGDEPYGWVTDAHDVNETGTYMPLVTYGDSRASTNGTCDSGTRLGLFCSCSGGFPCTTSDCDSIANACTEKSGMQGWKHFITTNSAYVNAATAIYAGPGIWGQRSCVGGTKAGCICDKKDGDNDVDCNGTCVGGSNPGAACNGITGCTGGGVCSGVCTATGKVYIRLGKTTDMTATEAIYGKVFDNDPEDPRNHAIDISYQSRAIDITVGGVSISNLDLGVANKAIDIRCTASCSTFTFDGLTIHAGVKAIAAGQTTENEAVSAVTVSNNKIFGMYSYWVFWTDIKNLPQPANRWQPGSLIDLKRGANLWTIHHNLIRGGFDAVGEAHCENNIVVRNNAFQYVYDDALEIEADAVPSDTSDPCNGRVSKIGNQDIYMNYFENVGTASATGQGSGTMSGDEHFYRNVVANTRDMPQNRIANLRTFNGGQKYGHTTAFKAHTFSGTQDTHGYPWIYYYYNTVVQQNSGTNGINILPAKVPSAAQPSPDTRAFGNIYVKVNGQVSGTFTTGSGCSASTAVCVGGPTTSDGKPILDYNLYWKYNHSDGTNLFNSKATVAAQCTANSLECHGIGTATNQGSDPIFSGFNPSFDMTTAARYLIVSSRGFTPYNFRLSSTSPARNGANGSGLGDGKGGTLPDSSGFTSTLDMGAIPYGSSDQWTSTFPFNQLWTPTPQQTLGVGVTIRGGKIGSQ